MCTLSFQPPSMRCAILAAFSHVICGPDMIPRYLRAGRDARIVRDIMTDQLQVQQRFLLSIFQRVHCLWIMLLILFVIRLT